MKNLQKNSDSNTLLDTYGIYLLARLEAEKETEGIQKNFEAVQKTLEERKGKREKAFQNIYRVKAAKNVVRQNLLEEVRDFQRGLLRVGQSDRKNTTYQLYFPQGLEFITTANTDDLLARMEKILVHLREEGNERLKVFYSPLTNALEKFKKEAIRWKEAEQAYESAFSQEISARMEWHKAYRKCEAELLIFFDANKNKVSSFFLKNPRKKKKEMEEKPDGMVENTQKTIPMGS